MCIGGLGDVCVREGGDMLVCRGMMCVQHAHTQAPNTPIRGRVGRCVCNSSRLSPWKGYEPRTYQPLGRGPGTAQSDL